MNIYQRLAAATAEIQTVTKNLMVETGKGKSYKAVSERDIIDAVKPIEAKYGIYSYPCDREILESHTLENETQYGIKTTFFSRIKTTYRFVNIEDPLDYIDTVTFAEGIDSQDKGSGKAMTYSDKYALMKAYKISTGDDPDQTASEETHYKAAITATPVNDVSCKCAACGKDIPDYYDETGRKISASRWASGSYKKFGAYYCRECIPREG